MLLEKTAAEINDIVERLGNSPMKENSHGFHKFKGMKIIDAAKNQAADFLNVEKHIIPAIALMDVVLAANRDYNRQVQPHIARIKELYTHLTFKDLQKMLSTMDYKKFKDVWGHEDEKKYNTLKTLVEKISTLGDSASINEDYKIMKNWAESAKLDTRKNDIIGSTKNVGVATFQHLRISFGIDTVKPDQRVKEVLEKEFNLKLSSEKAILAVQEVAHITGFRVIEIDQIFVKYGSGYY